jgi:uncharacterized damage-inducible protein DinB
VKPLHKTITHCLWANTRWIEFIAASNADDYVVKRISHILLGEQAWFQRIAGEAPDRDIWRAMIVEQLRAMQTKHEAVYESLLSGDLDRVISYQRVTGEKYQSSVSDILLHLVTHGAHHRGQVAAHIATTGARPPNTDFVQFCIVNGL